MEALKTFMKTLRERGAETHVHRSYQMIGLEVADILGDRAHKALYIKLAKQGNADSMMRIAKDVADRRDVKNKGAYFMTVFSEKAKPAEEQAKNRTAKMKAFPREK